MELLHQILLLGEANDDDDDNKIFFFNNEFYSHNNNDPNTLGNWYCYKWDGINPANFTTSAHKFIIQSGDTSTAKAYLDSCR